MMNSAILLKEMLVLQNAANSCKDILYSIQAPLFSFCDIYLTPLKLTAETDMARFKTKPAKRDSYHRTLHFISPQRGWISSAMFELEENINRK